MLATSLWRRQSHWEHIYWEGSHTGNISTEKAVMLGTSLLRRQSCWEHLYWEGSHAGNISTEKAVTLGTSLQRERNLVFYAQSTITVISGCSAKRRQSHRRQRRQSHWGHLYREGSHIEDICTEKAVMLKTSVQRRQSHWEHPYRLTAVLYTRSLNSSECLPPVQQCQSIRSQLAFLKWQPPCWRKCHNRNGAHKSSISVACENWKINWQWYSMWACS